MLFKVQEIFTAALADLGTLYHTELLCHINSQVTYTKYFSDGVKAKEITETIEKALAFYFENMEEN